MIAVGEIRIAPGVENVSAGAKLVQLAELGFSIARTSVPLGFDVERISATLSKMPVEIDEEPRSLFVASWPSDFFLGAIEIIGPDRINLEHEELYPGLILIRHGFICIGSDGCGTMYTYSLSDKRVYLFLPDTCSARSSGFRTDMPIPSRLGP